LENGEFWGDRGRMDPPVEFLVNNLEDCNLCDMEPLKLVPTWNNEVEGDGIAKWLDIFIME